MAKIMGSVNLGNLARLGNKEVLTDITDNELPLLLSKKAMKKTDTKIHFTRDFIRIYNVVVSSTVRLLLNVFDQLGHQSQVPLL